jgi:hypothetical protein
MPQFVAALLLPLITSSPLFFLGPAAVSAISSGLGYLAFAVAGYAVQAAFAKKPDVPKPEDGKYNLRQNVPSPAFVLGKAKKAGDYLMLEEKRGIAWHVITTAGHRINAYLAHYLHSELVTLDVVDGDVLEPDHFVSSGGNSKVAIVTRLGLDAETAYSEVVTELPTIWTEDHRGDGMATVMMKAVSVSIENHQKIFPQGMPAHSSVIEGALLYDPREETHDPEDRNSWAYSENLVLERLWHLTHPVGVKLTLDDIYLPDWSHAADVADETILNRDGDEEPRYHGGFWFRAADDVVTIGRIMDQAAELVIYERADGTVGVHAGEFVEPDVRLTENDIISVSFDANRRKESTVLAVRGRFTDPDKLFNTVDAAIIGNPYIPEEDSTERTKTVDNVAVQRHNHIQRLQNIAFIRANAPRVKVIAHYEASKLIPYRRFIRCHKPPRLDEAIIEIIGRPKLSLRNLTYEFEGIVIPATLYDFDAETQEGEPPPVILELEQGGVPEPEDFDVTIHQEVVSGGQKAAYGLATWTAPDSDSILTEVEWEPTAGGPVQSVMSLEGQDEKRTGYLGDGVEYKFRARNWSAGVSSNWTSYITLTAVADTVAPAVITSLAATPGAGQVAMTWVNPNSANFVGVNIRRHTANVEGSAVLVHTEYGPAASADGWTDTGLSPGTVYYWIRSRNPSGVEAASVASGGQLVT